MVNDSIKVYYSRIPPRIVAQSFGYKFRMMMTDCLSVEMAVDVVDCIVNEMIAHSSKNGSRWIECPTPREAFVDDTYINIYVYFYLDCRDEIEAKT